jgi:hypothetical protein
LPSINKSLILNEDTMGPEVASWRELQDEVSMASGPGRLLDSTAACPNHVTASLGSQTSITKTIKNKTKEHKYRK